MNFLGNLYYGNTVLDWIISLSIILIVVLLGKTLYWFIKKTANIFTSRTKNKLDGIVFDLIEEPIVFMLMVVGVWFSLSMLKLPHGLNNSIDNILHIVLSLLTAWLFVRLFDAFYVNVILPWSKRTENDLDDQLMPILRKGTRIIIWVLAIVIGLNNAGYNVGALLAGLGIGGLALAMAAKDTISNIFGSVTIFSDQPFKINDRIKIDGFDGTVTEIGVRSTRLKTLEGRIVTIPNHKFTESSVENVSCEPSRKVVLNLGLTYDTTTEMMKKAMDILKSINYKNPNTKEMAYITFNSFGDFSMNINFVYYIQSGKNISQTKTTINLDILNQFTKNRLEFAFPTQTLYNIESKFG
ncbi:MAG: mechanosensitive ion channel family protein [Thiohalomonadales bacterium]